MPGSVLLSTAYLPPAEYFARIKETTEVFIESEENYLKQSYRNRCYVLSASGPQALTVPVFLGSLHKTPVKDIRIDYSKRWQHIHLGAIMSAYSSSPFFIFYYEKIEKIILTGHQYLLDLNLELLKSIMGMIRLGSEISYTTVFTPPSGAGNDFRYKISPKKRSEYRTRIYSQVFRHHGGHEKGLSIIDLLFNKGPETSEFL